jgi:hypothetical protein
VRLGVRLAGAAGIAGVLVWATAAAGADDRPEDPGVRACEYVAAGGLPGGPAAVGALAAGSSVPELALSGARLRDARSLDEVGAASAQLTRVCQKWSAR